MLSSFKQTPWGWRAALPGVTFIRRPVELNVDTRPYREDDAPPPLNAAETALVRLILGELPAVVAQAEKHYRDHYAEALEMIEKVDNPHIWVSESTMDQDGPERWAFVVGIKDAPDWGTHIEFNALTYLGIWAGD